LRGKRKEERGTMGDERRKEMIDDRWGITIRVTI